MQARSLTGRPTVSPPDGVFDPDLLAQVPTDSTILLSDRSNLESPPLSRLITGQELLLSDARASAGGPSPTRPTDPLALRQRILSEAALEATKGSATVRPIVVTLPMRWDPGLRWRTADFFGGLRTDWLRLAPLPTGAAAAFEGELTYGPAQQAAEVGTANVAATRALVDTSDVLDELLANTNDVADRLTGAALQASAYSARNRPRMPLVQVLALDAASRTQLAKVAVTGRSLVTLSGGSGSLTVTIVNGLKQPITVGVRAGTDASVQIETPEPVTMQAGQRSTLRLPVTSAPGIHDVTIYPVTTTGDQTGTPLTFSMRTSSVGRLIWYIVLAGGTLLAVMVVRRIVLRLRNHRWRAEETL